jgi:hypothetical protein
VPRNSRVAKEREFPEIAAEICSADTHAVSANKHLSGAGSGGFGDVNDLKTAGLFEANGFHGECFRLSAVE